MAYTKSLHFNIELDHTNMADKKRKGSRGMLVRTFVCDFPDCEKIFNKKWRLIEHQRGHTGEVSFEMSSEICFLHTFICSFFF